MVARHVGAPVKLELTRAQMFTLTGRRQETMQRLRLGATRDGQLTAIDHDTVAQTSVYGEYADPVGSVSRMLYACPNVATRHRLVRVNAPQPNPARAPGEGPGSFALETALDELAAELALDPLELRRRNFAARDQHADLPWSSNGLSECWRAGAQAFGWDERWQLPGSRCDGREAIGWGMASACYPAYRAGSAAEVAIDRDDRFTVRCGTQDIGTGTCTVLAQLAAETLGVPLDRVAVELGDTRLPEGPASAGARATASFAPAVEAAARALRARLAAREPARPLVCAAEAAPAEPQSHSAHGFGAVFVEVRVDTQLATVRVARLTAAYAIGRIVNPLLARSQLVGGLVGGIGMALHEETVADERLGRIVNHGLADYLMPTHADMPAFDVHLIDERDPHLASGIKGSVGMIGTVGTAAAIANAVYHATGRRVRTLPIRCERLL
jgi:xanthine dehydrogenase YagR molybdenum-binding subunit